eukprot:9485405-Pyramimonas_sp.AAC.1
MRLASRADTMAGAALVELTNMSERIVQLQTRYMEQNMHRAYLLEQVACQTSNIPWSRTCTAPTSIRRTTSRRRTD